jgi:AcrR family transcriptional regulator
MSKMWRIALCEGGGQPTFGEVAERAMVSRATAYRYFSSVEALISEAMFERAVQPPERVYRPGDDPIEAISRAAREMNGLLLADEVGLHRMERSFMSVWLDNEAEARPQRPGRRMKYIAPVVEGLKEELPPAARRRLSHSLSMVLGTEAVLALRDIAGASEDEAIAASVWAAQALVRQARAEAVEAREKRAGRRAAATKTRR